MSGILSTPASPCLDSDRSSSAAGFMDPGNLEGNFVSEPVKVAPANSGYASQVRRVRDSAVCGLVSAPDLSSGSDLRFRPVAGASAGFRGARSARGGQRESVPETLHAPAGDSNGIDGFLEVDESVFSRNSAAAANAAAGAGENHSKDALSVGRPRRPLVTDPPGLALHATADEVRESLECVR